MIRNPPPKHPASAKWYWFEWSEKELQAANLSGVVWTLPAGIVSDQEAINGRLMGIKLSGGTEGADYDLVAQVTTSLPETLHETVRIRIRSTGH